MSQMESRRIIGEVKALTLEVKESPLDVELWAERASIALKWIRDHAGHADINTIKRLASETLDND